MSILAVISPHLDDAVCSVGAAIARRVDEGADVVVVSVCSRTDDPARADEDRAACQALGARAVHLAIDDAPLRGHSVSWAGLCTGPDDSAVGADIVRALAPLLADADVVWGPLACGNHVDHRATMTAVLQLRPDAWLYEDRPYARARGAVAARWSAIGAVVDDVRDEDVDDADDDDDRVHFLDVLGAPRPPARQHPRVVQWQGRRWTRHQEPVGASGRRRRLEALSAHASQFSLLVGSADTGWPYRDLAEFLWRADP